MRKNSGFTMLEMITVIAIMAIVSAIAIPNLISYARNYRFRAAASELFSDLQYARIKAVRESSPWGINFTTSTYTVQNINDITQSKTVMLSQEYPGVVLNPNFTGSQVTFYPDGTSNTVSAAANNTVMLSNSSCSSNISVTPEGGIIMSGMICH